MSDAHVIATVTAALRTLIHDDLDARGLVAALGPIAVSALPPDRVLVEGGGGVSRLDLVLYRVMPDSTPRSAAPVRGGAPHEPPPLALELGYLLAARGVHELDAELLLGCALQFVHETPVLTHEMMHGALRPDGGQPPALPLLAPRPGDAPIEPLRLVHEALTLEELTGLWTAMHMPCSPAAALRVSGVRIPARRARV